MLHVAKQYIRAAFKGDFIGYFIGRPRAISSGSSSGSSSGACVGRVLERFGLLGLFLARLRHFGKKKAKLHSGAHDCVSACVLWPLKVPTRPEGLLESLAAAQGVHVGNPQGPLYSSLHTCPGVLGLGAGWG